MVFSDFRLLFEVKNHAKKSTKKSTLATYFWEGVRNRSGTLFSSILDRFWTDFWSIFCIILEVFFVKNVVLPAWELIFKSFHVRRAFFVVGRHFRNSCFTCMGAQCSRIYLKFRLPFFKYQNCKKM